MKFLKENKKALIAETILNVTQEERDQVLRLRWSINEEMKQEQQ